MKKWFKHQWVTLLVWKDKVASWVKTKIEAKPKAYEPKSWSDARPTLDEYADDQIKMLMLAVRAYRKAKANPDAFVEHYFGAKIAPRPAPDTWAYDMETGAPDQRIDLTRYLEEDTNEPV